MSYNKYYPAIQDDESGHFYPTFTEDSCDIVVDITELSAEFQADFASIMTNHTNSIYTGTDLTGTGTNIPYVIPSSLGGDLYVNVQTWNVYKATATSVWDYVGNIKGDTGNGISSITKSASWIDDGRVIDQYKINYTDGTYTTFTITNGMADPVISVNGQTGTVVLDADDVGALPDDTSIPANTSDLNNDSGFITSSDIPVTSVNSQTGDVTISVPTKVSDLQNDSGFITGYTETDPIFSASAASGITSSDITSWDGKAETSDIPTDVSDLNNDAGYITSSDIPVTSVNSKTGAVSLTATDVGALSSSTHIPNVPDFFYITFTYSNGTLTASESFVDTANAIADGLFADALLTYGTNTYRMNTVWDDNGQVIDYIKFVTADGTYTITYTNNDLSIDTNSYSSAFDVVITEENNELTCNATMLDILNAVWQDKTLNAVFNSSGDSVSLAYYIYTDENYGYVDFYGISQYGYVIGIKYSVADGLEYKQAPYSIYNVVVDGAYNDGLGNNIVNTYATKSELPTNISELNNDAGYLTATDILNGDWLGYGTEADTEPVVGLGLVGYMVLGDEGSTSPIVGTGKVGQMKII